MHPYEKRRASAVALALASLALPATTARAQPAAKPPATEAPADAAREPPPEATPGASTKAPTMLEAPAGGHVVTLDECIELALKGNVEARSAAFEVDAAEAAHTGSRGELLPKLRAEGNVQQWNSAFEIGFGEQNLRVREPFTWTGSVMLLQPLTGLIGGLERHKAESLGIDVARLQQDVTRRDTAFKAAELYLRVLEAKRLVDVATASVAALEGQRRQAVSLHANGVIAKNDLLRAELALSNARQREIQARGNVIVARGRLGMLLGLPAGSEIDVAPITTAPPSYDAAVTVSTAEAQASSRRAEVRAFDARVEQASAKVRSARDRLIPQVTAVGNYTHVEGSAFQQKNAAFVGLVGSWDVWDWGSTLSESHQAEARREQAKLARVKVEEQVRLEARQAAVDAETAREALELAQAALEQAEENFRIVSKRFEQAAATAFDVVDAEALLTQSRAQIETANYGWLVARLSLQRAMGEPAPRLR